MKKSIVSAIIFIFLFSVGIAASDFYSYENLSEMARDGYYWDNFMDTAGIEFELNQSEIEFYTKLIEENGGESLSNGLDTELGFFYGIMKDTEVHGYLYSAENYTNIIGELKRKFFEKDGWELSLVGRFFYIQDSFTTPSIKFLSDKILNDDLILHNNLQLFLYEDGLLGKRFESGISYLIDPKNYIKARFKSFFINDITESFIDLRVAYKHIINDQTKYIFFSFYEKDNLHLENIIEYNPIPMIKLAADMVINTGVNDKNNFKKFCSLETAMKIY